MINSYRDLEVWKRAMELASRCYQVTKTFPKDELFGLTSQIRRAAASVPANIAEGRGRCNTREFVRFLGIANGSLTELETHLELAFRAEILQELSRDDLLLLARRVGQMLTALRRALRRKAAQLT